MEVVTTAEAETTSTPDVSIDGATAEIPFIPASLRQTAKPEIIDDAIVVVGQRQKKRKRAKKAGATGDGDGETAVIQAKAKAKTEEVVPFDFASAPNILDDGEGSEKEDGKVGKRKRQKKAPFGACGFLPDPIQNTDFGNIVPFQNAGTSRRRQRTAGRLEAEMRRILSACDAWERSLFFLNCFLREDLSRSL